MTFSQMDFTYSDLSITQMRISNDSQSRRKGAKQPILLPVTPGVGVVLTDLDHLLHRNVSNSDGQWANKHWRDLFIPAAPASCYSLKRKTWFIDAHS